MTAADIDDSIKRKRMLVSLNWETKHFNIFARKPLSMLPTHMISTDTHFQEFVKLRAVVGVVWKVNGIPPNSTPPVEPKLAGDQAEKWQD